MALGFGEGGEFQAPMGRVIIGRLLSSTLLTLFPIPVLFLTFERVPVRETRSDAEASGVGAVAGSGRTISEPFPGDSLLACAH